LLRFPDYNAIFNMNLPGTTTSAVNTVRTSDDFIMLKAITIKLFPLPRLWRNDIFYPAHVIYPIGSYSLLLSSQIDLTWRS